VQRLARPPHPGGQLPEAAHLGVGAQAQHHGGVHGRVGTTSTWHSHGCESAANAVMRWERVPVKHLAEQVLGAGEMPGQGASW